MSIRRLSPKLFRIETKLNYYSQDGRRLQKKRGPSTVECESMDHARQIELEWKLQLKAEVAGLASQPTHSTTSPEIVHHSASMGLTGSEIRRIEEDCILLLNTGDYADAGWDYETPRCFGNLVRVTVSRKHRLGVDVAASGSVYRRLLQDCASFSIEPRQFVSEFRGYLASIEDGISDRTHEPLSNGTYNRIIAISRGVWSTAIQMELVETNPISAVRFPAKRERPRNRTLTDAEIKATGDYLREHHEGLYYAFLFCLKNPIGYGDLRLLRVDDVDFQNRTIRYNRRKTGVAACPIIYPEIEAYIQRRIAGHEKTLFDLPQYYRWHMERIRVDGKPISYTWHDIRHHSATWLTKQGIPLHVIASIGGWSTVQMVERYHDLKAEHAAEYARSKLLEASTHVDTQADAEHEMTTSYKD